MAVKQRQALGIDPALATHMSGQVRGQAQDDPLYGDLADRRARLRGMTPGQRRKAGKDRKRSKATYDLPPEIIEAVQKLAAGLDCPPAHVAGVLMALGLEEVRAGRVDLREYQVESGTPRYLFFLSALAKEG